MQHHLSGCQRSLSFGSPSKQDGQKRQKRTLTINEMLVTVERLEFTSQVFEVYMLVRDEIPLYAQNAVIVDA
jgi:hypothetical protein